MTADVARNQWVKRIAGRLHSFGTLDDPQAALRRYESDRDALEQGREPDGSAAGITVGELVGRWITAQRARMAQGDIGSHTLIDYQSAGRIVIENLGLRRAVQRLTPADFDRMLAALTFGPTRRSNFVIWTRQIFAWAVDHQYLDKLPPFGKGFKVAPARVKRQLKAAAAKNLFGAPTVRALLDGADPQLRAMILLGVNGGFGNTDCATLPRAAINLGDALIIFPRPKTGVERTVPLWPQTVDALRAVFNRRAEIDRLAKPAPASPGATPQPGGQPDNAGFTTGDGMAFQTPLGRPWISGSNDQISRRFGRLLRSILDAPAPTPDGPATNRRGFNTLRKTFRTIADQQGDQHATFRVMGHVIPGMAGVYVQEISTDRLRSVTDHVRRWLFDATCASDPRASDGPSSG